MREINVKNATTIPDLNNVTNLKFYCFHKHVIARRRCCGFPGVIPWLVHGIQKIIKSTNIKKLDLSRFILDLVHKSRDDKEN
ncbi:MAG: hypothetical protein ACRYE8_02150 [Janthinobacterium lividum]